MTGKLLEDRLAQGDGIINAEEELDNNHVARIECQGKEGPTQIGEPLCRRKCPCRTSKSFSCSSESME